jgi:hypothetical protein
MPLGPVNKIVGARGGIGRQRALPDGGIANGIPRKAHDGPRSAPVTSPEGVVTAQVA